MPTTAKAIPKVDLALARAREAAREVVTKVAAVGTREARKAETKVAVAGIRTSIVMTIGLMVAAKARMGKVVMLRSKRPQTSSQLRTSA